MVHVGGPEDKESYVEEVGRPGRDGLPALALLLSTSRRKMINPDMSAYLTNNSKCRRDVLFDVMDSYIHEPSVCVVTFVLSCVNVVHAVSIYISLALSSLHSLLDNVIVMTLVTPEILTSPLSWVLDNKHK